MTLQMQHIIRHLFQADSLDEVPRERLEDLVEQHPSFGIGHYLLSKKLQAESVDRFSQETGKTNLYFTNPYWLQWLLDNTGERPGTLQREKDSAAIGVHDDEPSAAYRDEAFSEGGATIIDTTSGGIILVDTIGDSIVKEDAFREDTLQVNTEDAEEPVKEKEEENEASGVIVDEEALFLRQEELPQAEVPREETGHQEIPQQEIAWEGSHQNEVPIDQAHQEEAPGEEIPHEAFPRDGQQWEEPEPGPGSGAEFTPELKHEHGLESGLESEPETVHVPEAISEPKPVQVIEAIPEPEPVFFTWTVSGTEPESVAEQIPSPPSPSDSPGPPREPVLAIDPYHTIDYFASQGIRFVQEENPSDKLGKQLKSFTEWLRVMKRLPQKQADPLPDPATEHRILAFAAHSNETREIVTETMAEVLAMQGMSGKAADVYRKLSLLNPDKSAYFATKIEQLKVK